MASTMKYLDKCVPPETGCQLYLYLVPSLHSPQVTGDLEARQRAVRLTRLKNDGDK